MNTADGEPQITPATPHDGWDITSNLGATALGVAAQRAAETAQPDPLIRDESAAVLVAAVRDAPASPNRHVGCIVSVDDVLKRIPTWVRHD